MATLRETWEQFLYHFRTEGCPDPDCIVCKRSRQAKEAMDAKIKEIEDGKGN